jgi:hypothetical protein
MDMLDRHSCQHSTSAHRTKTHAWKCKAFGGEWVFAGFIKLAHDIFNLAAPYFLQRLLRHIQSKDEKSRIEGLFWALGLFICGLMVAVLVTQYFVRVFEVRSATLHALQVDHACSATC